MHDAFEPVTILEKLPLQIDCLAAWEEWLLVGTKQGHLLLYRIRKETGCNRFEVILEKSNKNFSKKIQQIHVVSQFKILVSLLENNIYVHDLLTFQQITTVSKAKGATLFTCDLKHSDTGEEVLRMCVAVRKKLQLFYWKDRKFHELQGDFSVPDVPKSMAWCKDSICVGFKRDYYLIKVDGKGSIKELFPTGKQLEPLVVPLEDGKVVVGQDDLTVVLNEEGVCTQKCGFNWTDIPITMEHQTPYVVAVLPRYVEIRTFEPRLLVQSIELDKPRFITSGGPNIVYVASNHFVWRLIPVSIATQIQQLLQDKQFELALQLADMKDDSDNEKQQQIHHIKNLYAFNLFCQKRFDESMQVFAKLGTDPTHVIGLYPELLPGDYKKQLQYPNAVPSLSAAELEKAHLALIDYLTHKRSQLVKKLYDTDHQSTTSPLMEGTPTIKSKKKLIQIIDTTLLKCFLHPSRKTTEGAEQMMSDQDSNEDQMGAADSTGLSFHPGEEASDWMANLQLEEESEQARWSVGVGRLPELEKTPPGVTSTRPQKGESAWMQEQKESLLITQALQLLKEAVESRRSRERYVYPAEKWGGRPRDDPEAAACGGEREQAGEGTAQASGTQAGDAAAQGPPARQEPPQRQKKPKIPPISEKFGGDPKKLGFFLTQVWNHMQDWGEDFLSDAARVRCVTKALEGVAAEWMVGLHNNHSPLLRNYDHFMRALKARFEDPLAERKARIRMKSIHQGQRSVVEYTREFRELAPYMRGWSEVALLENYKDGLNEDIYKDCCSRRVPEDLQSWYVVAADVENDLARSRLCGERSCDQPPSLLHKGAPKAAMGKTGPKPKCSTCFKCGKEGHRATECFSKSVPKATFAGGKKADKTPAKAHETALKGEVVEFTPLKPGDLGTPTIADDSETDTNSDDDLE